jgi:hypothetical protein
LKFGGHDERVGAATRRFGRDAAQPDTTTASETRFTTITDQSLIAHDVSAS